MAKRNEEEQRIFARLEPEAKALGLDLVDVRFQVEDTKTILSVKADKRGGISLDECAALSERVDPIVDNELKITRHDFFEVSSPGAERKLDCQADFERYAGETVSVKLYKAEDGVKKWTGILLGGSDESVVIDLGNEKKEFSLSAVAAIKREFTV